MTIDELRKQTLEKVCRFFSKWEDQMTVNDSHGDYIEEGELSGRKTLRLSITFKPTKQDK